MSDLSPCPRCQRHVREATCPFCGSTIERREWIDLGLGRLSRAMVFASATLAAVACGGGQKPGGGGAGSAAAHPDASVPDASVPDAGAPVADAQRATTSTDPHQPSPLDGPNDTDERQQFPYVQHHPCSDPDPKTVAAAEKKVKKAKTKKERAEAEEELAHARMSVCAPYGAPPARRRVV